MVEEFLKRVRSSTGIKTQKALAKVLGIDPSSVATAKTRGKVPEGWAYKLESKFGVSARWLLTGGGDPHSGVLPRSPQPTSSDHCQSPLPDSPSQAVPESLPIARAVADIEQAMRRIEGVDETAVWRAIKALVDGKLKVQDPPPARSEVQPRIWPDDPHPAGDRPQPDGKP